MKRQVSGKGSFYGNITTPEDLEKNLEENCVPPEMTNFFVFLAERRKLMAQYIHNYYERLS